MSPFVLIIFLCFSSHVFGVYRLSTFIYKGNVAYYNRIPALKEIVVSSNIDTLSHCAFECHKLQFQCQAIEICIKENENLCRLCNYTCPTFTKDEKDVCRHLQSDHSVTGATKSCLKVWQPVFLAKSGNGEKTYDAWNSAHTTTACVTSNGCLPSDICLAAQSLKGKHLTSPLISNWMAIGVQQVKVELYKNRTRVADFLFNGEGSNKMNWFSAGRLIHSSYVDIGPNSTFNRLSIEGEYWRRFYINRQYGMCHSDFGWMYIADDKSACRYQWFNVYPQILYGINNQQTNWNNAMGADRADSMAVHILGDRCND